MTDGHASRQNDELTAPASELNPRRLDPFLRATFPELATGPMTIERTVGGLSNPTYFIGYGEWSVVLRKQPDTILVRSAHSIDREFRIMSALQGSAVPVPKPILYYAPTDVVGTPFYLMERLRGRVFQEYAIPALSPRARAECYDSMCRTMAAIHTFDWRAAGLSDYGRPGNYFERQLNRWSEQWQRIRTADNPYVDELIAWLRSRVPSSDCASVCHGDLRIANLMFHPTEPRVVGVLDWELSTLGHPLADVAFNLQAWRMMPDENGGIRGLDCKALGIPAEQEYLEAYYRYSGMSERLSAFHMAFAMFRAAVGVAGAAARGEAGNPHERAVAAVGRRLAAAYARAGMEAIESGSAAFG